MSLRSRIREGAAEVLGLNDDLSEAGELRDRFTEVNADARILSRRAEDLTWTDLSNPASGLGLDPSPQNRRENVKQAFIYYFNDPIVGRTVDLFTNYVFAKGVPKPKYRDNRDATKVDEDEGQAEIDRFWNDPYNQKVLFGEEAQRIKATELQLLGDLMLLIVEPEEVVGGAAASQDPIRIVDLPPLEFTDVVPHPGNSKIPVFYERTYTPKVKDFASGNYQPGDPVKVYYRDWRFPAPTTWKGKPWGPKEADIAPGKIYQVSVNRMSGMKFGRPEVTRYLKWAKGLNDYMTARMALVKAVAQIAMRAKVRGGPRHVEQVAQSIDGLAKIAEQIEGATDLTRSPASASKTKVAVENEGVELQPNVSDTNAGNAVSDLNTFKGQVAAGSGVPIHHLGGEGSANLATATAMDAPLQRLCEARQEMWEGVYRDLVGYVLEKAGQDASRLDVTMPPILQRDVLQTQQVVTGVLGAVDPNISNRDLIRFSVGEVLDAMGKQNTSELLDQFFPEDWQSPMEQAVAMAQVQQDLAAGAGGGAGAEDPGGAGRKKVAVAAKDGDQAVRRGRRLAGRDQGPGNAIAASQDRATTRRERSLSAPAESAIREDDGPIVDAEVIDVPPELSEIAAEVLELLPGDDGSE